MDEARTDLPTQHLDVAWNCPVCSTPQADQVRVVAGRGRAAVTCPGCNSGGLVSVALSVRMELPAGFRLPSMR